LEAHKCSADHSPAMDSDGSLYILNIFCQDLYEHVLTAMGVIGDKCRIFTSVVSDLYCIGPQLCVTDSMHSAALAAVLSY
jgi:hypothetical protein